MAMKTLSESIAKIVLDLHPDSIKTISNKLLDDSNASPVIALKNTVGSSFPPELIESFSQALGDSCDLTNKEISSMFQASSATTSLLKNSSSVELVWTGPSNGIVPIRHTAQILKGLIDESKKRLFLVSFVAYNIVSILDAIQRAIERGVDVSILLEQSKEHGGSLDLDSILMIRKNLPSVRIYEWDKTQSEAFVNGRVHAKCAAADGRLAFITSANLTDAALERNMELGVFFKGGDLPAHLQNHLESLVISRQLKKI
jgi:cardiolipin synthase